MDHELTWCKVLGVIAHRDFCLASSSARMSACHAEERSSTLLQGAIDFIVRWCIVKVMSKLSDKVKNWRIRTKHNAILAFGGKCAKCGYSVCSAALEFHHVDPTTKDKGIAFLFSSPKSIESIVKELSKCVLLCSNCHREIHANLWAIKDIKFTFDPSCLYPKVVETPQITCRVCGKPINKNQKYCSQECVAKARRKVKWEDVPLQNYLSQNIPMTKIGEMLGVSDNAVRKHAHKIGLI